MNIFYLSPDEMVAAQMHCDSHCSKMIIEYAQLMSTAHRVLDGEEYYGRTKNNRRIKRWLHPDADLEDTLYKASHINHPSGIWVRQSRANGCPSIAAQRAARLPDKCILCLSHLTTASFA